MGPHYRTIFIRELNFIIHKAPKYTWGGSTEDLSKGLDCSGYIFRAAKWAGMPVRRTTSQRMAMGQSGWISREVSFEERKDTDLVFWTFSRERPNGHVGVVLKRGDHVSHASGSRNRVVLDRFKGVLLTDINQIKRLTIGD